MKGKAVDIPPFAKGYVGSSGEAPVTNSHKSVHDDTKVLNNSHRACPITLKAFQAGPPTEINRNAQHGSSEDADRGHFCE